MRWFKHMTAAHMDAEMDRVLEECGAEIYGIYWLILEDIGTAMEAGRMDPSAVHSDAKWAQIARVQPRVWRSSRDQLAKKLLRMSRTDDNRLQISVPNLLKYKDEYSKKSGHYQEQNRYRADTDTDTEEKQRAASSSNVCDTDKPDHAKPSDAQTDGRPAREVVESLRKKSVADPVRALMSGALQRMLDAHLYPSNPQNAFVEFERALESAANPTGAIAESERNHELWCTYWRQKTQADRRTPFVPTLDQFFRDGYQLKQPPQRDGPVAVRMGPGEEKVTRQRQETADATRAFDNMRRQRGTK